jgi:hypothetical protein
VCYPSRAKSRPGSPEAELRCLQPGKVLFEPDIGGYLRIVGLVVVTRARRKQKPNPPALAQRPLKNARRKTNDLIHAKGPVRLLGRTIFVRASTDGV